MGFQTTGDQANFLGRITLRFQGVLEVGEDCRWCVTGGLSAEPDVFDFNRSNRGPWKEMLTTIGRNLPGVPYRIYIVGIKHLAECGSI